MATINKITILALGLIGGSLAKALKENGFAAEVVAWGRREQSLKTGLELGMIDSYSLDLNAAIEGADIVVVCSPTLIAADMVKQLVTQVPASTVITDVASVKGNLLKAAIEGAGNGRAPANLVLAHPIAGSEKSGVSAAKSDLFVNHRVILTPTDETDPKALRLIRAMWESTRADVVEMPVDEHDQVLAATSHLPHILAYTLVDALVSKDQASGENSGRDIFRFAAGGFRDFTRIASSDPTMWHEIALANSSALLKMIDLFSGRLSELRNAIETSDSENIMACFSRAKSARDKFAQMMQDQSKDTISAE
jgi:prephenate dehydrogenase